MAIKGYSAFPKIGSLNIRLFSVIPRTLVGEVLSLCSDAIGVFYSPSRLGHTSEETWAHISSLPNIVWLQLATHSSGIILWTATAFCRLYGGFISWNENHFFHFDHPVLKIWKRQFDLRWPLVVLTLKTSVYHGHQKKLRHFLFYF